MLKLFVFCTIFQSDKGILHVCNLEFIPQRNPRFLHLFKIFLGTYIFERIYYLKSITHDNIFSRTNINGFELLSVIFILYNHFCSRAPIIEEDIVGKNKTKKVITWYIVSTFFAPCILLFIIALAFSFSFRMLF